MASTAAVSLRATSSRIDRSRLDRSAQGQMAQKGGEGGREGEGGGVRGETPDILEGADLAFLVELLVESTLDAGIHGSDRAGGEPRAGGHRHCNGHAACLRASRIDTISVAPACERVDSWSGSSPDK